VESLRKSDAFCDRGPSTAHADSFAPRHVSLRMTLLRKWISSGNRPRSAIQCVQTVSTVKHNTSTAAPSDSLTHNPTPERGRNVNRYCARDPGILPPTMRTTPNSPIGMGKGKGCTVISPGSRAVPTHAKENRNGEAPSVAKRDQHTVHTREQTRQRLHCETEVYRIEPTTVRQT